MALLTDQEANADWVLIDERRAQEGWNAQRGMVTHVYLVQANGQTANAAGRKVDRRTPAQAPARRARSSVAMGWRKRNWSRGWNVTSPRSSSGRTFWRIASGVAADGGDNHGLTLEIVKLDKPKEPLADGSVLRHEDGNGISAEEQRQP